MTEQRSASRHPQPGYEPRDVSPRLPLYTAIAVLTLLAVLLGGIALAFHFREDTRLSTRVAAFFSLPLADPQAARLQASPDDDLQRMRALGSADLNRYGWVDRDAGVVHIPIEEAMTLYIKRAPGTDDDHSEAQP